MWSGRKILLMFLVIIGFSINTALAADADYGDGMLAYSSGDYDKAFDIWQDLAAEGHVRAQFNVAYMFEFGIVSKPDYSEAIKWYRKAANQGYARAQNFLGWMYEMGKGVDRNRDEAMKWLKKAADQGNEDAIADYKLVLKRHNRDLEKEFKSDMLQTLIQEIEQSEGRYDSNAKPTVLLEASNSTG